MNFCLLNFYKLFKNFCVNNARLLGSIFIFSSVMLLLGLPYSNWGFFGDDFGNILNSQIHELGDLVKFIKFGNVAHLFFPSNYISPPVHFFNVLYRPMVLFIFGFLSMLFGVNAKAYFLTIILIHAVNSVFLFNIFIYFVEYSWAFLGALLFAFHPTLFGWFGWIAALPYQIDLLVIIFLFFLLKKFIETGSIFYLIISGLIYFNALLVRETLIVLPGLIVIAMLLAARITKPARILRQASTYAQGYGGQAGRALYNKSAHGARPPKRALLRPGGYGGQREGWEHVEPYERGQGFERSDLFATFTFLSLASAAIFYLLMRLYFFPFQKTLFHSEFLPRIWNGIFVKFFYFVYALPGLYVFFPDHFYLRCALTTAFLALLLILFIFNKKKSFLIFLLFCVVSLSWCQMYNYCNRYFYVAVPFFILFVLSAISYLKTSWPRVNSGVRKIMYVFLSLTVIQGMFFVKSDLAVREERSVCINNAFDALAKSPTIYDKIVYFIDIPYNYFLSGVAQALWLRGCNVGLPIYSYDVGLSQDEIDCLGRSNGYERFHKKNNVVLINIFKQKLAPIEAQHKHAEKKSCWIFWDSKNFKFFEVDFYENDFC